MVAFVLLQDGVVPQKLVKATAEGEQYQGVDEEELDDVDDHSAERYLLMDELKNWRTAGTLRSNSPVGVPSVD